MGAGETAAIICLCFADLMQPGQYYDSVKGRWREMETTTIERCLRNCEERFSLAMVEVLKDLFSMGKGNNKGKLSAASLVWRLEDMEGQLSRRETESVANMRA